MAAASSGDPGGSRELWPGLGNSLNGLGGLTYLQLIPKHETKPLPQDPFIIGASVEKAAGGAIEGASTEAKGTRYMLKVRKQVQVRALLKLSMLMDGTEVVVQEHPTMNISRCVISCFELIHMEEQDVLHHLTSQGVIRVQRITRKDHGLIVNTSALILTFNKCNHPSYVKVGLLRVATRSYYPNPLLCYGCFRFGHPRLRCPGPKRCFNCSKEHELAEEECTAPAHCINCGGAHRPNNRQCPVFKREVEIVRLKVDYNLTFPEARKRIETGIGSYADAAARQSTENKLDELMKKMEAKEARITQLMDDIKRKDDKMERMMVHIRAKESELRQIQATMSSQMSQRNEEPKSCQVNQQSQASQSGQQSQLNLPAVAAHQHRLAKQIGESPVMRQLRNRSPAITEPKGNGSSKKQKRKENRHNNTSQSPPPKKTAEKTATSDQDVESVDEDYEVEGTPLNHHVR